MVFILKEGASKKDINNLLRRLANTNNKSKGIDVTKYVGEVRFKDDPMEIQKTLRDNYL